MTYHKKTLLLINATVVVVIVLLFVFSVHFFTNLCNQVHRLSYLKPVFTN